MTFKNWLRKNYLDEDSPEGDLARDVAVLSSSYYIIRVLTSSPIIYRHAVYYFRKESYSQK